jgi:hypothetical protein
MQENKAHSHSHDQDENGKPLNAFGELLRVCDLELLIRLRRRLEKIGKKRMVQILSDEIEERERLEKAEAQTPRKK